MPRRFRSTPVDIAESSLYKTTTGIALGDYAILKADGASVTYAPALSAKTSRQITVSPVNNATTNGQSVEYACATSGNILPTAWQDNTTFRALTPGTTYYIYVRSAENANHKPGSTLVSTPVTTNATSPDLATPPDGDPQDNGAPQPVTVTGPNGMGPITIFYDNAAVVPVNAGTYSVTVDIAESSLYKTATGIAFGDYVIVKADGASATYAPALSAKASRQITVNPVNNCATNGRTVGYACATFDNILPK